MKKVNLIKAVLAAALCVFFAAACQNDAVVDDGSHQRDYSKIDTGGGDSGGGSGGGGGARATGLYAKADGFDIAPWGSWKTDTDPIAEVSNGADGGVRLTSIPRSDEGTYMGVNLAPGSGSGANADLNGNGFKQIKCKLRGTVKPAETYLYIINGAGNSKVEVGKDKSLSNYVTNFSETTWSEVIITGLNSTAAMSAGLIVFADNGGCNIGDWIEIKEIDWQDASGNSVIPTYNN